MNARHRKLPLPRLRRPAPRDRHQRVPVPAMRHDRRGNSLTHGRATGGGFMQPATVHENQENARTAKNQTHRKKRTGWAIPSRRRLDTYRFFRRPTKRCPSASCNAGWSDVFGRRCIRDREAIEMQYHQRMPGRKDAEPTRSYQLRDESPTPPGLSTTRPGRLNPTETASTPQTANLKTAVQPVQPNSQSIGLWRRTLSIGQVCVSNGLLLGRVGRRPTFRRTYRKAEAWGVGR